MARPGSVRRKVMFVLEIIVLLVLIGGLYVYGQVNSRLDKLGSDSNADMDNVQINPDIVTSESLKGYTNIAMFGIDSRGEGSEYSGENSDTVIIASINNESKEVKLVSVYRDTLLDIGNDSYQKCNAAYANGGPEQALTMLNTNLDLNITEYATVDFNALVTVIDLLGGLEMELTHDEVVHMNNYCVETSEVTGKDYTPIDPPEEKGTYTLNGVQATSFARIRYTAGGDMKRTERQREVISKIVEKAKKAGISTISSIMDEVFPMVKTSLSKQEILDMAFSMLAYKLGESRGFPFQHLEKNLGSKGDCVVPVTLSNNVVQLHQFLFNDANYSPSEQVSHRSEVVTSLSGFGEDSIQNATVGDGIGGL